MIDFTSPLFKILMFASMLLLANKWSRVGFKKEIRQVKNIKKKYGWTTLGLVLVWWLITPSIFPDDLITVWLITTFGLTYYLILVGALSLYLIYRMRITITIYQK